jgi:tetratricopeptide (TPR) repeat protein
MMLAAVLAAAVLACGLHERGRAWAWGHAAAASALGAAVLLLVPPIYVAARCQNDAGRLADLLDQSRFGEAQALARRLLVLDPSVNLRGPPLHEAAGDIDRVVHELEARVARPLAADATPGEKLDRARRLAMLGRTGPALDVLDSVREPAAAPHVANLRGTIHESEGELELALASYERAREAWAVRPPSPVRHAELLRALTGIAYCRRKLGDYPSAESAYQEVLALSPSADSHFLLAQFYEDAQHAGKARDHARRAAALAPDRYGQEGEKLIRKLRVFHFGCLGVFGAERADARATLAAPGSVGTP